MKAIYLLLLCPLVIIPISAFNSGFQPVYQPNVRTTYAQLSDNTTQTCLDSSAIANITFSTNNEIYGILHSNSTNTNEMTVTSDGVYQFIVVPQVGKTTPNAQGQYDLWMTVNNVQVDDTTVSLTLQTLDSQQETQVLTLNWVGSLQENDIVSFQQRCSSTNLGIIFTQNNDIPDTPSIIASVVQVGK